MSSNAAYGSRPARRAWVPNDFAGWVRDLEIGRFEIPVPDLQILLDVPDRGRPGAGAAPGQRVHCAGAGRLRIRRWAATAHRVDVHPAGAAAIPFAVADPASGDGRQRPDPGRSARPRLRPIPYPVDRPGHRSSRRGSGLRPGSPCVSGCRRRAARPPPPSTAPSLPRRRLDDQAGTALRWSVRTGTRTIIPVREADDHIREHGDAEDARRACPTLSCVDRRIAAPVPDFSSTATGVARSSIASTPTRDDEREEADEDHTPTMTDTPANTGQRPRSRAKAAADRSPCRGRRPQPARWPARTR